MKRGEKMKNNSRFEFPDEIDIQPFLVPNHPNTLYQLVRFINHSSSANSGHYVSYNKFNDSEWYLFNDSYISTISQQEFEQSNYGGDFISLDNYQMKNTTSAYVLIYQLKS
jgi:ubiquitin C-terminal hydrolase